MPGGVAAFDYDGDGLTDIYFANGASLPSLEKTSPRYWNRLYRNLGGFHFQDVTESAGVAGAGYSMGAAAADYDNDGLLDLFAVNYVRWSPEFDRFCGDASRQVRVYCHPQFFESLPNTLYHNEGNGRFKDVSRESGITSHIGKGMGVAVADYDRDGLMDVFVANDKMPNFLFHNLGHGKFEEVALQAGAALLDTGNPVSGMGVDFRDYNNDGLPDIALDALGGETFRLFGIQGRDCSRMRLLESHGYREQKSTAGGESACSISTMTAARTCSLPTLIPMKAVSDSDLIPVTRSDAMSVNIGAQRRWRRYRA